MKKKAEPKLLEAFYYGQFKRKKPGFFNRLKRALSSTLRRLFGSADTTGGKAEIKSSYGTGPKRRVESLSAEIGRPGAPTARAAKGARNNVIITIAASLILIIVVFAIAYIVREASDKSPRLPVEKKSESRVAKERAALGKKVEKLKMEKVEPAPAPAEVFAYKIRVITLPSRYASSVEKIIAFFKDNGIEAVSRTTSSGKHIVIYAGAFVDADSAECRALLKKIRGLKYEGRSSFKGAYVVKVR